MAIADKNIFMWEEREERAPVRGPRVQDEEWEALMIFGRFGINPPHLPYAALPTRDLQQDRIAFRCQPLVGSSWVIHCVYKSSFWGMGWVGGVHTRLSVYTFKRSRTCFLTDSSTDSL